MTTQTWKFIISPEDQKLRLDQLISKYANISRNTARFIIKTGGIQVDKKRLKIASKRLKINSQVTITYDKNLGDPSNEDISILFEDEWLLIVDKPAGMPSQGTRASDKHDLIALMKRKRPNQKLTLQHRLDQGTSGILVIAKHPLAYINNQFESQTIVKKYLARVIKPVEDCIVNLHIGKLKNIIPTRYGCSGDLINTKMAITKFTNLKSCDTSNLVNGCWIMAEPYTGRTHQIRVHLSNLGSPILGDLFYKGEKSNQLWLHAWKLEFKHPITGIKLHIDAIPKRFYNKQIEP